MTRLGSSSFNTAVVSSIGETPRQFDYECSWGETIHAHGLAGLPFPTVDEEASK